MASSGGRKCPAGEIQVCERQQREHLGPVLGDAAITHLAIAELALNDAKHMLDSRAHLAEPVIAGTLASRRTATSPQAKPTSELFSQHFLMRPFARRDPVVRIDADVWATPCVDANPISR